MNCEARRVEQRIREELASNSQRLRNELMHEDL